jgi:hypothetical protein
MILTLPLLAAACALPIPIQVASWVIDGVSYLATNKSIADHGISAISGKDCAMLRTLTLDPICKDRAPASAVAFVDDWDKNGQAVKTSSVAAGEAPDDGRLYYVLGSFDKPGYARGLAELIPDLGPSLLATQSPNGRMYHVIVGPIGPGEKLARQKEIAAAGFYEVRAFAMAAGDSVSAQAPVTPPDTSSASLAAITRHN